MVKGPTFQKAAAMQRNATAGGGSAIPVGGTDYSYFGNSEGGIFGAVYMSLTQDVHRGLLGVTGGPYGMLLPRSKDFQQLFPLIEGRYKDPVERIVLLQVIQMLWDRAEPAGYMDGITDAPYDNTEAHQVLMHYGKGDAQVPWLGCLTIARSAGAHMFASNIRIHGEHLVGFPFHNATAFGPTDPATGQLLNAVQGYDFGAPDGNIPLVNLAAADATDAHEKPRRDPRAQDMMVNK
jgi:hypothetical protein